MVLCLESTLSLVVLFISLFNNHSLPLYSTKKRRKIRKYKTNMDRSYGLQTSPGGWASLHPFNGISMPGLFLLVSSMGLEILLKGEHGDNSVWFLPELCCSHLGLQSAWKLFWNKKGSNFVGLASYAGLS